MKFKLLKPLVIVFSVLLSANLWAQDQLKCPNLKDILQNTWTMHSYNEPSADGKYLSGYVYTTDSKNNRQYSLFLSFFKNSVTPQKIENIFKTLENAGSTAQGSGKGWPMLYMCKQENYPNLADALSGAVLHKQSGLILHITTTQ